MEKKVLCFVWIALQTRTDSLRFGGRSIRWTFARFRLGKMSEGMKMAEIIVGLLSVLTTLSN